MALISIKREVDLQPGLNAPAVFHCSQGDVGTTIMLGLLNGGEDYSITQSTTIQIKGSRSNGEVFSAVNATWSGSTVSFALTADMTATAGPTWCEAVLTRGSDILGTANFILDVEESPTGAAPRDTTDATWSWILTKMASEDVDVLGGTVIEAINTKAVAQTVNENIAALVSSDATISDDIYSYSANTYSETQTGRRLTGVDGLSEENDDYKLIKFSVTAGDRIRVISDDKYQFQNGTGVPTYGTNANLVGVTYGALSGVVTVPTGASYIIMSTPVSGGTATIYNAMSIGRIDKYLETISPQPELTWMLNKSYDGAGNLVNSNYMASTELIDKTGDCVVVRRMQSKDSSRVTLLFYVTQYNSSGTWLGRTTLSNPNDYIVLSDSCAQYAISIGRTSSSGVQIQQSDIDTYFDALIYSERLSTADLDEMESTIDTNAMLMRGRITDLGYTTFGACTQPGIYVFTTADVAALTDAPPGLNAGGYLIVSKNGSRIWQEVSNNTSDFIRYGATSVWYDKKDKVYISYVGESGDDNSTEQINVDIPAKNIGTTTRYSMGHCVNDSVNADVWRIMYMYYKAVNSDYTVMTRKGEYECAVHLLGRDDFSGGIVHGDEVDSQVEFFIDGTKTAKASCTAQCREFKIVRNSNLYDPDDHTTVIAKHGVEYIFTVEGLRINQALEWMVAESLTNCYLAMFPILKTYSTYRYDDTDFSIIQNPASGLSVQIPNAKAVTEYNSTTSSMMRIARYPEGLTGGDMALLSDNGGLPYNKVYFVVCSEGTSTVGEKWSSTTEYIVR